MAATIGDRAINWNAFLERQHQQQYEREVRLQKLHKAAEPSYVPMLCRNSLRMADRAESAPKKRSYRRSVHVTKEERECTFTPTINKKSAQLQNRSLHELSVGEQTRRQDKLDAAKAKKLEDEMEVGVPEKIANALNFIHCLLILCLNAGPHIPTRVKPEPEQWTHQCQARSRGLHAKATSSRDACCSCHHHRLRETNCDSSRLSKVKGASGGQEGCPGGQHCRLDPWTDPATKISHPPLDPNENGVKTVVVHPRWFGPRNRPGLSKFYSATFLGNFLSEFWCILVENPRNMWQRCIGSKWGSESGVYFSHLLQFRPPQTNLISKR